MTLTRVPTGALWLPGVGMTSVDEQATARAIAEYDPDLILGHRRDTNEWVVFTKKAVTEDGQPFPVFGFGTRLPGPDEAKKRLYESDVRRHGAKIAQQINKRNEARQQEQRKIASEASEAMAEALVAGFRNQGADPFPTSFRNLNKKNRKYRRED